MLMKKRVLSFILFTLILIPTLSQVFYKNKGVSKSVGSVSNGSIENAYKLPVKGDNFRYFSIVNYYIIGRCYTHSSIYKIIIDSYKELEEIYPDYTFRIMECSKKKGGRPFPHQTHQNGTSVDFMTPLHKNNDAISRYDKIGMWRYLMKFDEHGKSRINKNIKIDFNKLGQHILILEKHAKKNGYRIKKVILETNLKDELFASKFGNELKTSGIYFVKYLPKRIDELHDDHYHIDFEKI